MLRFFLVHRGPDVDCKRYKICPKRSSWDLWRSVHSTRIVRRRETSKRTRSYDLYECKATMIKSYFAAAYRKVREASRALSSKCGWKLSYELRKGRGQASYITMPQSMAIIAVACQPCGLSLPQGTGSSTTVMSQAMSAHEAEGKQTRTVGENAPYSRWSRRRFTRPSHLLFLALEMRNQSNGIDP